MINLQLSRHRSLSMSFIFTTRLFGPSSEDAREVMEVDIYENDHELGYMFINRGIAICNPLDTFDARIGAKKALASAMAPIFDRRDKQRAQDQLDAWFDR